ncbi:MAG: hypothetical protein ACOY45_05115 [Pseudomonadota bacterium]
MSGLPAISRRRATYCPKAASDMPRRPGLVGDAMFVRSFFGHPALKKATIGVLIKAEQRACLFQHLRHRARTILAYPVGDQVLDRNHGAISGLGHFEQPHAIPLGLAVEQRRPDDFEAKLKLGVNPAAQRHARAARPYKAMRPERRLESICARGHDVEVAGRAARLYFHRRAADPHGRGKAARLDRRSDFRKQA